MPLTHTVQNESAVSRMLVMIPTDDLDNGVGLGDGLPRPRVPRKRDGQRIAGTGSPQCFILLASNTFSCEQCQLVNVNRRP